MSTEAKHRDYIARVMEPHVLPKFGQADEQGRLPGWHLKVPIGRIDYTNPGNVEIARDGVSLRLNYANLDPTIDSSLIEAARGFGMNPILFRKVHELNLQDTKGHQVGLGDIVIPGWNFIFAPDTPYYSSRGQLMISNQTVVLAGDPAIPEVLLSALHEGGHVHKLLGKDDETIKSEMRQYNAVYDKDAKVSLADIAFHMREERDAWAYVAKKIAPLCAGSNTIFTKPGVREYIHERLKSVTQRVERHYQRHKT